MPFHDLFAEMLLECPLTHFNQSGLAKPSCLIHISYAWLRWTKSRLGGAHMSHSAVRSEEVVISAKRSRTGGAGEVDLNQQFLPSPQLQAERGCQLGPRAPHVALLGSSADSTTSEAAVVQLLSHTPILIITALRKALCGPAVA